MLRRSMWVPGSVLIGLAGCGDAADDSSPPAEQMALVMLAAPDAVCNDGSPAGYYLRSSSRSPNWLVFLEGGGGCVDRTSCADRQENDRALMSSKGWSATFTSDGILSTDEAQNPIFFEWNHVYLKYCTSDGYVGNGRSDNWEFRGRVVLEQVVADLERRSDFGIPEQSARFVIAGCSAGGFGTIANLDALAQRLGGRFTDVRGITDAGWMVDVQPAYGRGAPSAFDLFTSAHAYWHGAVDQSCADASPDDVACYFGQSAYPHVTAPLLVQINQHDPEQIGSWHGGGPTDADDFAGRVRESLVVVTDVYSPNNGVHCSLRSLRYTGGEGTVADGFTLRDVVLNWLEGHQPTRVVAP